MADDGVPVRLDPDALEVDGGQSARQLLVRFESPGESAPGLVARCGA